MPIEAQHMISSSNYEQEEHIAKRKRNKAYISFQDVVAYFGAGLFFFSSATERRRIFRTYCYSIVWHVWLNSSRIVLIGHHHSLILCRSIFCDQQIDHFGDFFLGRSIKKIHILRKF